MSRNLLMIISRSFFLFQYKALFTQVTKTSLVNNQSNTPRTFSFAGTLYFGSNMNGTLNINLHTVKTKTMF